MSIQYRTFIHKGCDKDIFGPLFARNPFHLKVGTGKHAYFTDTLEKISGLSDYIRIDLSKDTLTGQELYELVNTEIGDNNYLGAIETTEEQASLMRMYLDSISAPTDI